MTLHETIEAIQYIARCLVNFCPALKQVTRVALADCGTYNLQDEVYVLGPFVTHGVSIIQEYQNHLWKTRCRIVQFWFARGTG